MKDLTDLEIIASVKRGNQSDYAIIIDRYKNKAFSLIKRMLKNELEAEEVLQDCFFKAYNALSSFRQEAKFIAGAARSSQLPKISLPQVAFVGKSNVGKSSLINAICRRKSLARVSHTPGRTQQINFFSIAEKLVLVDLPGYGFAKVPLREKENWERLILHYLQVPLMVFTNLMTMEKIGQELILDLQAQWYSILQFRGLIFLLELMKVSI